MAAVEDYTISSPAGLSRRLSRLLCSRPVLFLAFGGAAAIANLATGRILYGPDLGAWIPYWCATAIAAATGLVVNFALNHAFNFRFRHRPAAHQFRTFCAVSGLGILLTSGLSSALRALLESSLGQQFQFLGTTIDADFGGHFLAVGLVAFYSYPAHRFLSFNIGIRARLRQAQHLLAE
jgi:putative flippase GtrA